MNSDWTKTKLQCLRRAISHKRLIKYRLSETDREADLLSRYFWNIALSECFYPVLHNYEVALRNHFYQLIANVYGDDWLININIRQNILCIGEEAKVKREIENLKQQRRNKPYRLITDDIISSLGLGFWTNLSYAKYEDKSRLYPILFTDFDFMPKLSRNIRKRKTLSTRFGKIHKLRNTIFHHEPIWDYPNLKQEHDDILESIRWISPLLSEITRFSSHFLEAWNNELFYAEMVKKQLDQN